MLTLLLVLLLACHLLCMNIASAGPLVCIWLNRKKASSDSRIVGLSYAWMSYWMLPIGVLFGLAVGLISWSSGDGSLIETLPFFRSKVLWGIAEIGCSAVWGWMYWAWLRYRAPQGNLARFGHAGLAVMSSTNLLYHFPPLMTVMSQVANGEIEVTSPVSSAAYRALVFTPNVMAHTLHIWLASFAVSGVYLFWLARNVPNVEPFRQQGALIALVATLAQVGSGLWLMVATPPQRQNMLLGGDIWVTGLLVASMLAAFQLVQQLAAIAFGEAEEGQPKRCAHLLVATVVMMTGALHLLRS